MTELKPCPFCGERPMTRVTVYQNIVSFKIRCCGCGVTNAVAVELCDSDFSVIYDGLQKAVALWNRRAEEEKQNG